MYYALEFAKIGRAQVGAGMGASPSLHRVVVNKLCPFKLPYTYWKLFE